MRWTAASGLATMGVAVQLLVATPPAGGMQTERGSTAPVEKEEAVRAARPAFLRGGDAVVAGGLCLVENAETGELEALEACEFVVVGDDAARTTYTLLDVTCTPPPGRPFVCYDGKLVASRLDATTRDALAGADRRKGVVVETTIDFHVLGSKNEELRLEKTGTLNFIYRYQDGDPAESVTVLDPAGETIYTQAGAGAGGSAARAAGPKRTRRRAATATRRPRPDRPVGNRREPSRFDCGPASCTESCRAEAFAAKGAQQVFDATRWQGLPWVTLAGSLATTKAPGPRPGGAPANAAGEFDFDRLRAMQQAADDYAAVAGLTGISAVVDPTIHTGGCSAYWAACEACLAIEAQEAEREQAVEESADSAGAAHGGPQAAEERCEECTWCQPVRTRYWVEYDDEQSPPEDSGSKFDCLHWVIKTPPCEPCD